MIAIQLIDRFEFIHSKYIIHRDVKPDNILVDYETNKILYVIDFGLAKKYRSSRTGKHIKFSIPGRMNGSARYASVNTHEGKIQSRRDDLESLGYLFIDFAKKGKLPWQGIKIDNILAKFKKIYFIKKRIEPEELCKGLPKEFSDYIKYVKNLKFEENPDYNYLRGLFLNVLNKNNYKNNYEFSWLNNKKIKKKLKINNNTVQNYSLKKIIKKRESPQTRIYRKLLNSKEKEKNNTINSTSRINYNNNNNRKKEETDLSLKRKNELLLNKDMSEDDKKSNFTINNKNKSGYLNAKTIYEITQYEVNIDNNVKSNNISRNDSKKYNENEKEESKENKVAKKNNTKYEMDKGRNSKHIEKNIYETNNNVIPININTLNDSFKDKSVNFINKKKNNNILEKVISKTKILNRKITNSY